MPNLDGLEATKQIVGSGPGSRVLILATFDLDEYAYRALTEGASGFLLKNSPPEQLIGAVRVIAAGDALLSPSITRRVIEEFSHLPPPGGGIPLLGSEPGLHGDPTSSSARRMRLMPCASRTWRSGLGRPAVHPSVASSLRLRRPSWVPSGSRASCRIP
jgi:DNA-binding NarL/FixJ family response regulator